MTRAADRRRVRQKIKESPMSAVHRILAVACLALACAASPTRADTPAPRSAQAAAIDVEEQVDDGLKKFGYLTGLALGCVASSQRATLEREAVDLNTEILRLLGSDRAFFFAASFGYGSNVEVKTADCKSVLERYEARVASFRASRGGRK
jgi:hypothetical protein